MRLTLHTDYALRALIYLALRTERRVSIREIAEAYQISENHLVKVIHNLGRGGFVETIRGRGGGLRLGRAAGAIRVGEVVRYTEEDLALVSCFPERAPHEGCALAGACGLQSVLGQALAAFLAVLDGTTLADLTEGPWRQAAQARLGLGALPPGGQVGPEAGPGMAPAVGPGMEPGVGPEVGPEGEVPPGAS